MSKTRRGSSSRGRGRSRRRTQIVHVNPIGNPVPQRVRRSARRGRAFLASSGIGGAARSMLPMLAGALSAKLIQKKFGDKTDEFSNWTWKDYATGALGTLVASLGAKHLLRASPATSQKIMEGGFLFLAMKIITNELVQKSETAKNWFGSDEGSWQGVGAQDEGSWSGFEVGDLYDSKDGQTYVLGADGYWRPWDSSNRVAGADEAYMGADEAYMGADEAYMGEPLSPPGRLGGDEAYIGEPLSPPGRLGENEYL